MIVDSLPKPRTLEGVVEHEVRSPTSTVQINRYHWEEPREALFKPDAPIINIVLSRSADMTASFVESSRPEPRRVGDILFMPPHYTLHSRWDRGEQRSMCCVFDPNSVDELFEFDWEDRKLNASLNVDNGFVCNIMMRLVREALEPRFAGALLVESLSTILAIEVRRHFDALNEHNDDGPRQGGLSFDQLRRIRERIEEEDASHPATVASLAQREGMSVRHFLRLFRTSAGKTVSEYAAQVRIERAKALLADDRRLIKEIAYRCGFQSSSSFSSAFRRATGLTPQQFRGSLLD